MGANGALALMRRSSVAGRTNGLPRTKLRSTHGSCATHSGPIVSVSHPGVVHCVTIGMWARYPFETIRERARHIPVPGTVGDECVPMRSG